MNAIQIGINLAENSFQIYCIGRDGKAVYRKKLSRAQMLSFFTIGCHQLYLMTELRQFARLDIAIMSRKGK